MTILLAYIVEHAQSGRRYSEVESFPHDLSAFGADVCRVRWVDAVLDDNRMRNDVLADVRRKTAGHRNQPRREVWIDLQILVLRVHRGRNSFRFYYLKS